MVHQAALRADACTWTARPSTRATAYSPSPGIPISGREPHADAEVPPRAA